MKFPLFRTLLIGGSLMTGVPSAQAGTIVVSNLQEGSATEQIRLIMQDGAPVPADSMVRVGCFGSLSSEELVSLAASGGLGALEAAFVEFGDFVMGDGSDENDGLFEAVMTKSLRGNSAAGIIGKPVYLFVSVDQSSEFLIIEFPDLFAADSESGLEQYLALTFAEGDVILGTRNGSVIKTSIAPAIGTFSDWISGYAGISDTDPEADPDGDGHNNFLEYAMGSDPGSETPDFLTIDFNAETISFPRLTGNGLVSYVVEATDSLASDNWSPMDVDFVPADGALLPDGVEWNAFALEKTDLRKFVRLRIE